MQLVRLYISNDADYSFLYSLELPVDRYSRVREEEQLLVDFAGFAEKVAWLLCQCCGPPENLHTHNDQSTTATFQTTPRFRPVLQTAGPAAGTLRFVESNAFKELSHLALLLKNGTDASIKQVIYVASSRIPFDVLHRQNLSFHTIFVQFLAFRLAEMTEETRELSHSISKVNMERDALLNEVQVCQCAAVATATEHANTVETYQANINDLKTQLSTSLTSIQELTSQLNEARASFAAANERATHATDNASANLAAHEASKTQLTEAIARLQASESHAQAAETTAAQITQRCQGFEAALQQAEARIEELKKVGQDAESRANSALADLDAMREAARAADKEVSRLNDRLQESLRGIDTLRGELSSSNAALTAAKAIESETRGKLRAVEVATADAASETEELKRQLEEMKTKCQASEKMVAWLNRQLTSAQLQATPTGHGQSGGVVFANSNGRTSVGGPDLLPRLSTPPHLKSFFMPSTPSAARAPTLQGTSVKVNNSVQALGGAMHRSAAVGSATPALSRGTKMRT